MITYKEILRRLVARHEVLMVSHWAKHPSVGKVRRVVSLYGNGAELCFEDGSVLPRPKETQVFPLSDDTFKVNLSGVEGRDVVYKFVSTGLQRRIGLF